MDRAQDVCCGCQPLQRPYLTDKSHCGRLEHMSDDTTRQLAVRWHALEAERAKLHHLPTGDADPALHESQIDEEMDRIEFQTAELLRAARPDANS